MQGSIFMLIWLTMSLLWNTHHIFKKEYCMCFIPVWRSYRHIAWRYCNVYWLFIILLFCWSILVHLRCMTNKIEKVKRVLSQNKNLYIIAVSAEKSLKPTQPVLHSVEIQSMWKWCILVISIHTRPILQFLQTWNSICCRSCGRVLEYSVSSYVCVCVCVHVWQHPHENLYVTACVCV